MDLEDLDYDVATSPVKPEETWAHTEDDAPLSGAESEPRDDDFDPDDGDGSASSDGDDDDDDAVTAGDADGDGDGDPDQEDSISTHSGLTMSRRESKGGESGMSGKEDDDDDMDGDDDEEDGSDLKEVDEQMGGLTRSASSPNHARRSPSLPPSLKRRRLFYPNLVQPPKSLHIDPHMLIPIGSPVHSLAASSCLSYVLTGCEDGYVRAWDTWDSANGKSLLTAHQRGIGGLGEGVTKGGVCRGWWANDVPIPPLPPSSVAPGAEDDADNPPPTSAREPVYSLAMQRDALWGVSGTSSGSINLFTIRHALGRIQHRLEGGHTGAISGLVLSDTEDLLYSASWDGAAVEWDLNTGKRIRTFPSQNVQLSSIALQPTPSGAGLPPPASDAISYSLWARDPSSGLPPRLNGVEATKEGGKGEAKEGSYDPLFDEDSEMTSISKPPIPPNSGVPSIAGDATSTAESQEEDASMTDLFGDEKGEVDTIDPLLAAETVTPSSAAAAASSKLALPNGAPKTNGSVSSTAPPSTNAESSSSALPKAVSQFVSLLTPTTYNAYSSDVLMTSSIDGSVALWDRRVSSKEAPRGVGRLEGPERTPKWCMSACFNASGAQVWAGRRNGAVDIWDVRRTSSSASAAGGFDLSSNTLKTLKNPAGSGAVSCLVAFPDGRHMACAQTDNVRLWSTDTLFDDPLPPSTLAARPKSSGVPFKIVPGHHGGIVSSMLVDPLGKFLITASGNRGWAGFGESTSVVLFHTIEQTFGKR